MTSGPLLFARYAYAPNALGYCGPADHGSLLEYGAAGVADVGLVQLAQRFEGAWPYLEIIARSNAIPDPLDPRVVQAYWVGNDLLERVDIRTLGDSVDERFRARAGRSWDLLADAIPAGAVPHHSFHVLNVYPWIGLLRAGRTGEPLTVMDRCRIRWGKVVSLEGDLATVRCRPLAWDGYRLTLDEPGLEQATATTGGKGFVRDLRPGEWVSLHWNWVCDRLSVSSVRALSRYTRRHLAIANGEWPHASMTGPRRTERMLSLADRPN